MGLSSLRRNIATPIISGNFNLIIPVLIGLLIYGQLSRKYAWTARIPISLTLGVGTGVAITGAFYGMFLAQIISTMKIKLTPDLSGLNSIILLIAVIAAISYFTFSREHTGALGMSARIGRIVLMAAFGAQFAGSISTRLGVFMSVIKMLIEFPLKALGAG
jgi:hypothetical protein